MSSDERHPSDFLHELASAIKAVRDRGGKWNRTADTIQWAYERIERERQPSLLREWLRAKHEKICPMLEFEYPSSANPSTSQE